MELNEIVAVAALALGAILLLWLGVADAVLKRTALTAPAASTAEAEDSSSLWRRFPPDPRYFAGIWLIIFSLGAGNSITAAWVLGGIGAVVLFLAYRRSGVEITESDVVFGTLGDRIEVPLEDVGAVVAAPKSALGRAFGVYGVADRDGQWVAAIRYHTLVRGPVAVAALIACADLQPVDPGRTWIREGGEEPRTPLPFVSV